MHDRVAVEHTEDGLLVRRQRPYTFTGKWVQVPKSEWRGTHHAQYCDSEWTEIWECRVADRYGYISCGVLIFHPRLGWHARLLSAETAMRCYWSDSYSIHRDNDVLSRERAQDLCEAALVAASLFGLESVGGYGRICP